MKSLLNCCTALLLCLIVSLTGADPVGKPVLKGITVRVPPFTKFYDNNVGVNGFRGYAVDLMKLIAEKAGFTFTLTHQLDGKYGMILENGTINGMLGEVYHKRIDFALADITVTPRRAEFVAFSEPFMESPLGAILKAEAVPAGATTLKDLLNSTSTTLLYLKSGSTETAFKHGNSSLARAFWERMQNAGGVPSMSAGFKKVVSSSGDAPSALIGQTSSLEYRAGQSCQPKLVVLPDDSHLGDAQYAIGLQKGSAWLGPINEAIRELKANGKLAQLKTKYWASSC